MYQSKLTLMASNRFCKVESTLWAALAAESGYGRWEPAAAGPLSTPAGGERSYCDVFILCLSVLFPKPTMHLSRH